MRITDHYDRIVIGAGSLGLNLAYGLAQRGQRIIVLEREQGTGRLSTSQNARLWSGLFFSTPEVAALTMAGLRFLDNPRSRFFPRPITRNIDVLYLAGREESETEYKRLSARAQQSPYREWSVLTVAMTDQLVPQLPEEFRRAGIRELGRRLDVYSLLEGLRAGIEDSAGFILDRTEILGIDKTGSGNWCIATTNGTFIAPTVINAAGAKGDMVAKWFGVSPVGLQVTKRHRIIAAVNEPHLLPPLDQFVFLPDIYFATEPHGRLMFSGADETQCDPADLVPDPVETTRIRGLINEYLNVTLREENIEVTAGHRPFVLDRNPVIGPEPGRDDYYALLAPGGYGMQAGPAMAKVLEAIILGDSMPEELATFGVRFDCFSVERIRRAEDQRIEAVK